MRKKRVALINTQTRRRTDIFDGVFFTYTAKLSKAMCKSSDDDEGSKERHVYRRACAREEPSFQRDVAFAPSRRLINNKTNARI